MSLPSVEDFAVTENPEDDLDGLGAWRCFGGLSREEAYAKLCESPETHQEHFMWMGDRAFAFYFAALERYLRDDEPSCEFDEIAFVVAHDIGSHLPARGPEARAIYDRLTRLCDFVLDRLRGLQERDGRSHPVHEVTAAWRDLRAKIV